MCSRRSQTGSRFVLRVFCLCDSSPIKCNQLSDLAYLILQIKLDVLTIKKAYSLPADAANKHCARNGKLLSFVINQLQKELLGEWQDSSLTT
jgi:hypothetical protein